MLLGIALRSREAEKVREISPEVQTGEEIRGSSIEVPGGREITIHHRFRGRLSRASLTYEIDGQRVTAGEANNCDRALGSRLTEDELSTTVELTGRVPNGVHELRLVVEDETGRREVPVLIQQ